MRSKIEKIASVILTIVIIVCVLGRLSYLFRPADTDQCIMQIEAFHSLPDNSVEVMIYGSSHAWRGVENLTMYEDYGIGAYNYAANWQNLSTEELFFYDSLRTQKPKVVMIETYLINNTFNDVDLCGEIYYTRAIKNFDKKQEYLSKAFAGDWDKYFTYYFPLSMFHSYWNQVNVANYTEYYSTEELVGTMGYYYAPFDELAHTTVEIGDPDSFTQLELSDEAKEKLDGIVKTCRENDIEVVFFTVPWEGENLFQDAMTEYAKANGCTYLNLFKCMDEIGLDTMTDFADDNHVTTEGARKIASYLGKYLDENYNLTDMREIEGNLWEGKYGNRIGQKWMEVNLTENTDSN